MRALFIFSFVILFFRPVAQNYHFCRIGQVLPTSDDAGLIIRNTRYDLKKLPEIHRYKEVKCLKLVGFNMSGYVLDTLLPWLSNTLQPKTLIVENCDLTEVSNFGFRSLEKVSIIKNSEFYETSLFQDLRYNPIETLEIQTTEDLLLDSLGLLSKLKNLHVSDGASFDRVSKVDVLYFTSGGITRNVQVSYAGDLFKTNLWEQRTSSTQIVSESGSQLSAVDTQMVKLRKLVAAARPGFIRQPLPNISINDTSYVLRGDEIASFSYASGSEITIDKNAFVNERNESYTGEVRVFYREFRNSVDIMLSGIPMSNIVNGEEKLFRSGGMYEMYAFDSEDKPLKTRSDTSVKVDFVMTDTCSEFQFYALKPDKSWQVQPQPVVPYIKKKKNVQKRTKAIEEYMKILTTRRNLPDTTLFEERFHSDAYLGTYRKDNLIVTKDSTYQSDIRKSHYSGGFFYVKYIKRTKEGKIIFAIKDPMSVPYYAPKHLRYVVKNTYIYHGELSREEFKKRFNRHQFFWDMRVSHEAGVLNLVLKSDRAYVPLRCEIAIKNQEGKYEASQRSSKRVVTMTARALAGAEKTFNKRPRSHDLSGTRFGTSGYNSLEKRKPVSPEEAYKRVDRYKSEAEREMSFNAWQLYVKSFYTPDEFQVNNEVNAALVKSGMGISNIDVYIHSGEMQNVLVNYEGIDADTVAQQFNVIMYKTIGTSYRCSLANNNLAGYYLKGKPNYLIRFSSDNMMQVTRPKQLADLKNKHVITVPYVQQYNVSKLSSDQIAALILEDRY